MLKKLTKGATVLGITTGLLLTGGADNKVEAKFDPYKFDGECTLTIDANKHTGKNFDYARPKGDCEYKGPGDPYVYAHASGDGFILTVEDYHSKETGRRHVGTVNKAAEIKSPKNGKRYKMHIVAIHKDGTKLEQYDQIVVFDSKGKRKILPYPEPKYGIPDPGPYGFTDVKEGDSHYLGVMHWSKKGVINGYQRKTDPYKEYRPHQSISRQHVAVILARVFDLPKLSGQELEETLKNYKDVTVEHEYAQEIAATYKAGIFTGSNGNFMGDRNINREQMATVLVNAYELEYPSFKTYVNLKGVDPSHMLSVDKIGIYGITNQTTPSGGFRPNENVTRGQFATFLFRTDVVQQTGERFKAPSREDLGF